jgi:hypothetical protein
MEPHTGPTFSHVMECGVVVRYQYFGGILLPICHTVWHRNPEDSALHSHWHENPESDNRVFMEKLHLCR